jgi:hypothetical protein
MWIYNCFLLKSRDSIIQRKRFDCRNNRLHRSTQNIGWWGATWVSIRLFCCPVFFHLKQCPISHWMGFKSTLGKYTFGALKWMQVIKSRGMTLCLIWSTSNCWHRCEKEVLRSFDCSTKICIQKIVTSFCKSWCYQSGRTVVTVKIFSASSVDCFAISRR